jgi:hypothetical protein
MPNSPGHQPCTELETRAGIWLYDANKTDQRFSPAERYATGLRNGEGFAFDSGGRLFVTQHGRDQLSQNWPRYFNARQSAELPAEEIVLLQKGADYGWPECYYDQLQNKLVLAPEYGGDGKAVGVCAGKQAPVAAFPGHWAPNDLLIYAGNAFSTGYQGGAFVAFHGSWNRAPEPQGGYNVVFQPLADGRAAGPFIVFADGFAGAARIAGIERGVGLDNVVDQPPGRGAQRTAECRDHAGGHRRFETERIADSNHQLSALEALGIAERGGRQRHRLVDANERQVGVGIVADQPRLQVLAVGRGHGDVAAGAS